MTYEIHADIAESGRIRRRVVAAAAQEGKTSPAVWAANHIWALVKTDWISAVRYARDTGFEGDPLAESAVITDGMILSAVQLQIEMEKPIQDWSKEHLLTWLTSMGYRLDPAVTDPMDADQLRALADGLLSGRPV
jgi:hypothetical protein